MSDDFIDFLTKFFQKDPFLRPTINDIKDHRWINQGKSNLREINK